MFDRENGRVANAELSVFDAMMAEIVGEKNRRMRKYMRKHEIRHDGHPVRKEKRKAYVKEKCYQCSPWNGWDIVRNVRIAEKIRTDDADWKIEQAEIAEYEAEEAIRKFIIAEYDRIETERKNAEYAERLTEWLKYA